MNTELKFAVRSLLKAPGFTFASILTLALGLGATTAIFSVLYAVLLRPFPYPDSDQLVVMWQKGPQMEMSIAWPTIQDWQKEQQAFSALAVHRRDRFNLSDPGQLAENVTGAFASPELFDVALPGSRYRSPPPPEGESNLRKTGPAQRFYQLYQVKPWDPLILAGTALLLAIAASLACFIPARRATRINPTEALRTE